MLALGNRFRRDDGIGAHVLDMLRTQLPDGGTIDLFERIDDALGIIASWENAALAVVIDAARPGREAGRIDRFDHQIDLIPHDLAACSSHGLGLAEAVRLGELLGRMPERLIVYAVQAQSIGNGTGLSGPVLLAGREVFSRVWNDLQGFNIAPREDAGRAV